MKSRHVQWIFFCLFHRHISSNCDGVTDSELKASVKQMKADNKKQSDLHEYFKKVLKIADGVEELPESCQPIAGLLLGVITGYYEQEVNCIPFTDVIKTQINLPKDETNGLQGMQFGNTD